MSSGYWQILLIRTKIGIILWSIICKEMYLIIDANIRWLDSITDSMDMSLSKLCETVKGGEAWRAAIHGIPKSWTGLSDWTTTIDSTSSSYFNMKSPWSHKNRASKFMKQKLIELKETNSQLQFNISRLFVINRTDRKGEETGDLNHGTKVTNWYL